MSRRPFPLVALIAAATIAGCSGGSGSSTPIPTDPTAAETSGASIAASDGETGTAAPDAVTCATLLTPDELGNPALLGVPAPDPDQRGYPGAVDCTWTYTGAGAASQDFLQVLVNANAAVEIWKATADSESAGESGTAIAVDGIGDESYTWVGQGDYRKLYVRRGDKTLIIRAPATMPALASESSMIDLADRIFGRF